MGKKLLKELYTVGLLYLRVQDPMNFIVCTSLNMGSDPHGSSGDIAGCCPVTSDRCSEGWGCRMQNPQLSEGS